MTVRGTCRGTDLHFAARNGNLLSMVQRCDVSKAQPGRHLGASWRGHHVHVLGQPLQRGHMRVIWQTLHGKGFVTQVSMTWHSLHENYSITLLLLILEHQLAPRAEGVCLESQGLVQHSLLIGAALDNQLCSHARQISPSLLRRKLIIHPAQVHHYSTRHDLGREEREVVLA